MPGQSSTPSTLRGIHAIDKPVGPSSHDIINRLRFLTGERRIGHAGTLDPFASGVLVVGIGREATRELDALVKTDKVYEAIFRLGVTSDTDDRTGAITTREISVPPTRDAVQTVLQSFVGAIEQVPPAFSAIKQRGMKAYKLARRGRPLKLEPRTVQVQSIEVLSYTWPNVHVRLVTGPGVYIRAIARDLGDRLNTGGLVQALRRTRVGTFDVGDAIRLPAHPKDRGFALE